MKPESKQAALAQLVTCEAAILNAKDGEQMWFALKGKRQAQAALRGGK
jgi:hypothetical protein